MKTIIFFLVCFSSAFSQVVSVQTDKNGNLVSPANFLTQNITAGANVTITPSGNKISISSTGGGGGSAWGSITGTLSNQTDLQNALNSKLTASSNLSDVPSASTARTNLGLSIGANVQAWSANLDSWSIKTPYSGALTITSGKTVNFTNSINLSGIDTSTINIGSGGTLGSNAYTSTAYVPQTRTVNGHALSSDITVTASDVGLGSLTNDAQTKASVVPNTAPSSGQIPVGNAGGTAYAPVTMNGDGSLASTGAITITKSNGSSFGTAAFTSSSSYEVPLTFSTGLTRSTNTVTVNTSQNIATLSNLASNGFVKTTGGTGALSIDTNSYLTGNQTITLSGDVTGSGATAITTTSVKVNGVAYGASPSTNTVPVVTGVNAITYEAVPNAALANSAISIAGNNTSLGGLITANTILVSIGNTRGMILEKGSSQWTAISPGTSGYVFTSNGAGSDPSYQEGYTTLFSHFSDAGNSGTAETDLYSDTTAASALGVNGNKLTATYGLDIVSSATATREVRVYFGGTAIFDSGALSFTVSGDENVVATIIRDSATSIRYSVSLQATGAPLAAYVSVGKLTGLTLSNTNILKITGQSGGAGAATNDIVAILGNVEFKP